MYCVCGALVVVSYAKACGATVLPAPAAAGAIAYGPAQAPA